MSVMGNKSKRIIIDTNLWISFLITKNFAQLDEIIQDYAEFIDVKSVVNECRDEKDNFLLALAVDSEADYLLTGDGDLLEIQQFNSTQILRITEFIEIYK